MQTTVTFAHAALVAISVCEGKQEHDTFCIHPEASACFGAWVKWNNHGQLEFDSRSIGRGGSHRKIYLATNLTSNGTELLKKDRRLTASGK